MQCPFFQGNISPDVVMNCHTVDPDRKVLLSYYIYCLDGWSKQAPLTSVVGELSLRDSLGRNRDLIATAIYSALGERSEIKELTVNRLVHRLRWWVKS